MNYELLNRLAPKVENFNSSWNYILTQVPLGGSEYYLVKRASYPIAHRLVYIERCENVHRYWAFRMRQTKVTEENEGKTYYTLKKYVTIDYGKKTLALHSLLKLMPNVTFQSDPDTNNDLVFVVWVFTDNLNGNFIPTCESDYYIEYAIVIDG